MTTIIYYDANRTVRQLISQALRARSYTVVEIESLDDYRSAIDDNADVEAIILDMSRHPDRLPVLQNELPNLFNRPDRCIITIGRSNDLTPYLPESPEACFFKHVVERPFKKNEFVDFIASLIGNSHKNAISKRSIPMPPANYRPMHSLDRIPKTTAFLAIWLCHRSPSPNRPIAISRAISPI